MFFSFFGSSLSSFSTLWKDYPKQLLVTNLYHQFQISLDALISWMKYSAIKIPSINLLSKTSVTDKERLGRINKGSENFYAKIERKMRAVCWPTVHSNSHQRNSFSEKKAYQCWILKLSKCMDFPRTDNVLIAKECCFLDTFIALSFYNECDYLLFCAKLRFSHKLKENHYPRRKRRSQRQKFLNETFSELLTNRMATNLLVLPKTNLAEINSSTKVFFQMEKELKLDRTPTHLKWLVINTSCETACKRTYNYIKRKKMPSGTIPIQGLAVGPD